MRSHILSLAALLPLVCVGSAAPANACNQVPGSPVARKRVLVLLNQVREAIRVAGSKTGGARFDPVYRHLGELQGVDDQDYKEAVMAYIASEGLETVYQDRRLDRLTLEISMRWLYVVESLGNTFPGKVGPSPPWTPPDNPWLWPLCFRDDTLVLATLDYYKVSLTAGTILTQLEYFQEHCKRRQIPPLRYDIELVSAIHAKDHDQVRRLLLLGADPNAKTTERDGIQRPLVFLVHPRDIELYSYAASCRS